MEKIAIVTGGGRGIGAATSILLGQKGYAVCVNYLKDESSAFEVLNTIESNGGVGILCQGDVSIEQDVINLFEKTSKYLGQPTALVNNAGILFRQSRLVDMTAERFRKIMEVNIDGVFLCCREAIRRMSIRNGGNGGSIVNVSSAATRYGSPNEYVDYAASKGAVDVLTLGLAREVAEEKIRVNCVRPGLIYTDIHASGGEPERIDRLKGLVPMKRGGTAEEVAQSIFWLLSDEASYVTGSLLDISGGR
mgnify:CR=1 FL=1